ncbi:MAG: dihydroorotate dehydrogenase [Gammaproteobacteria bacterium]|nr:MAG: dihydroorotate dehydrogenase [Gammaproteobacteria bacterium]
MSIEFLGKRISGAYTIPSGIVATAVPIIDYLFRYVPQIGVMTTKSIGPEPRPGYREPVYSQYAPGCFVNAVGLTNPGAARSAELFAELEVPEDRFLLTSIFGGSIDEFVEVARLLAPYSDGLELNLSCPHAKGYGMAMGQDPELVRDITAAVKAAVDIPVVPKLTPNAENIGEIAEAAVAGGADGLCAINTVGPGYYTAHGSPVLSNELGGMSGKGVLPIGLKCVREIAARTEVPIVGCGGASSADDVRAYRDAGADIVGIGSALTGLTTHQIEDYFQVLDTEVDGVEVEDRSAGSLVRYDVDMGFRPVELVENIRVCDDICILKFDRSIQIQAGEFIFLWVPGIGEKPFSALTDDPFSLVVINVGEFTSKMMSLAPGARAYVRGPHGQPAEVEPGTRLVAVAGGTGLAAVYQLVRDSGGGELFVGARTAERLYFLEETRAIANTHVATDDGSEGFAGLVTDLLDAFLAALPPAELSRLRFFNCGPEPMVHAAIAVQRKYCGDEQIFSAIDYLTKCGVGVCGACAAPDGRRLCVDGPFLDAGASG